MNITQDDLQLAVRLLASEVDASDEWWDKATRRLLSRITGDEVACGCERCEGRGYLFNGSRDVLHRECDGKGYHTEETLNRKCAYCPETDPDDLTMDEGIWVCDDEQCGIDHAVALQGIDADRWCSG